MDSSTSTPRLVRVSLRSVPSPGSRVAGAVVPNPMQFKFIPKQFQNKQTQVTPHKLDNFMCLKMTQTDFEYESVETCDTANVDNQTSSEIAVSTAHDYFQRKMEEVHTRIGKTIASLKVEDFSKITTNKILANSGEEIVSHLSTMIKMINEKLGTDSVYTMFHAVNQATASFSGFHRSTVSRYCKGLPIPARRRRIQEMGKRERSRKIASRLTLYERSKIVKEVHNYWERKEKVTAERIWKWAKSSIQYRFGLSYFRVLLSGLGFCFKKLGRMSVLQERPNIIAARKQYLSRKETLNKENAFFAAFDETWAHDGMSARSGWQHQNGTMYRRAEMADIGAPVSGPEKPKEKGKRGIVLAVLTEMGTIPESVEFRVSGQNVDEQYEDYHRDMNSTACEEYMHRVIPLLAAAAAPTGRKPVLIMDNAPYHNKTREKVYPKYYMKNLCRLFQPPTSLTLKADLKKWLTAHGVPFPAKTLRPQLYKLSKEYVAKNGGKEAFTVYELDAWAEEVWGVEILRLPPYHCMWNPIEFLWSQTKQNIRNMGNRDDKVPIVESRTIGFLRSFKAKDAKALFDKCRKDEDETRAMMLEKETMLEDTDFSLLYETDEQGRLVNIRIDDSEDEDAYSDDEISAEVFEEHELSDIDEDIDEDIDDEIDNDIDGDDSLE
ncbi:hypothetical protein GCK72_000961 [Caenorhabditis remanei]|uniref:Tc1-like transposase DDE domain-containing protein n=1 Tax=Caenorhabditis remanei TaxID=31234 RepID=A0A6A5HA09_CAERE|nr:hypothetical protein GCK72_012785 [Caenorhabditis remanei]XP_053586786.1 hypothetical protein GCK72_009094 [Caenorhabditis remanei]XP_053588363.1 hypothetical protein GCK72_003651 [Caenorhabditis remanei]XP_053591418.1 hypothetical protein GCK72_000961 [Caenorhabditis remanei]KAF1756332.1 hypothetical protein GCK72_012785 [Caenorhabditis remanei]KAF1760844.1 hypothetical protein GCK72_009094 [Caenorhabditis remanei]KAF1763706.1 hypothetical protein GCK72_003651 [Caenorhabditis remanei]KAF